MADLLRDHTTLRVGGPAKAWVEATTESELIEAVSGADQGGAPVLVLGGGSNLLVADAGFPGTVVEIGTRGVAADVEDDASCGGVLVTVAAGEEWDAVVAQAVERGWVGIEALSGIPGAVGATPIQNVGAYGQDVAQTIASVRVWDRKLARRPHVRQRRLRVRLPALPLQGRPRPARRARRDLPVHARATSARPVAYAELARTLGVDIGSAGADGRRTRGGAGAAPRQGDGPRRRRPRHLERRARSSPTRSSTRRPSPTAPRPGPRRAGSR